MSDSVQPHRQQPTRLPRPWGIQARTLEWVAISFSIAWKEKMKVKSLKKREEKKKKETEVIQSCPTLSDPMDCSPPGSSCSAPFNSFKTPIGSILKTNPELNYFLFLSQPGPKPTNILSQDYCHSHLLASLFLQQLEWSFKNRNQLTSLLCSNSSPSH